MKILTAHTLLIVDDDPNDVEMTKRVLQKSGLEVSVTATASGEAALEFLRNEEDLPSVILLDLKMPGMGGLEALRRIRADERLKTLTVIVVTTSLLESDRNEALAAGADGFVQKAFDLDRFGMDIKAVLERRLKEG
jgi:two-component system response regulator